MDKTIIMGMTFDAGSEPDFGSIYRVHERSSCVNEYGLNSSDVSKLSLISNAAPGSTALCDDTGDLYRLTKAGWAKFGETSAYDLNASPQSLVHGFLGGTPDAVATELEPFEGEI